MKKPLTKYDLAKRLSDELLITPKNAKEIVDRFFDYITEGLVDNRHVQLDGLGRFKLSYRKAKMFKNNRTKTTTMIEPFNAVRFHACRSLKSAVRDVPPKSDADELIAQIDPCL